MNALCIGGPIDGRRVVLADTATTYTVVENERSSPLEIDLREHRTVAHRVHRYNLFRLHPVTRAVLFAHEELTPTQVMEALMDGYHQEATT